MLNPDMNLVYWINTTLPQRGAPKQTCRPYRNTNNKIAYTCAGTKSLAGGTSPAAALSLVQAYAEDNSLFLQAFGTAFTKMLAVGYGGVPNPAKDGATSSGKLGTLMVLDRSLCSV